MRDQNLKSLAQRHSKIFLLVSKINAGNKLSGKNLCRNGFRDQAFFKGFFVSAVWKQLPRSTFRDRKKFHSNLTFFKMLKSLAQSKFCDSYRDHGSRDA
jgi:hypothetical protein